MKTDTTKPHFALIKTRSVYHEGDERSRTNPGHGYPAYSEDFAEYIPYPNEAELLEAIKSERHYRQNGEILAVRVTPLAIKTKTTVELATP